MNNKFKLKSLNSGTLGKALTAGVLACVVSFGAVMPVYALDAGYHNEFWGSAPIRYTATGLHVLVGGDPDNPYNDPPVYETLISAGHYYFYNVDNDDFSQGNHGQVYYVDLGTSFGGTTYIAGDGIAIGSDNKVSVKAGTNVTVDGNGVSVTGNGSVASGNTGLINGGTAYSELRPSANGNYVKSENTTAGNLTALDQAIGKVANDGAYIKSSETKNVSQNLIVLDDMLKQTRDDGLKFGANSGDDVTNKIGSKVSIIGGGNKADEEYATENLKTIIEKIDGNTQLKIAFDKNPEFSSIKTDGDANIGGALNVTENAHLNSDLQVDGKTNIGGDTTIGNDDDGATLTVGKKGADNGKLVVNGEGNVTNKFTVGNGDDGDNLTVNGTTNLNGNTTVGQEGAEADLAVYGNTNISKNVDIGENLHVKGTTTLDGDATIGDNDTGAGLTIGKAGLDNGTLTLNGTSNITGDTTIGNDDDGATLTVGKEGADNGKFVLNGDGNVTNTFTVGNGDAGDNLTVNGTTNLNGDTTIGSKDANANLKVYGNSDVSGNGHYGGNLKVDGNADVGGTLTADRVVTNDIQLPSGSLNGRLDEMDTRMDKVGAGAAALAGLHYPGFVPGQKFVMAMGVGNYHGKTASAIGAQYRFNENVAMNLAGTFGNGENMISGGLSFAFGKSKLPRDRENEALKAENKMLLKRLEKLEKWAKNFALIEQKKAAFSDIPNNHWARNAVETLKGNGYVEGYPDGEFKGDKRMSRYEYAQMLYRALSKGASISEEQLKEYEPELHRIQKDYEAEENVREMEARREAQAMASAQQGSKAPEAQPVVQEEPKAPEVQPAVQEEPVNAQPVQEAKAEAPAAPEAAPVIATVPPMEEGMSRYDYARQIFEVLKGGAAIDRSLAMEFEPELRQIIQEERAKGTLPQQ